MLKTSFDPLEPNFFKPLTKKTRKKSSVKKKIDFSFKQIFLDDCPTQLINELTKHSN